MQNLPARAAVLAAVVMGPFLLGIGACGDTGRAPRDPAAITHAAPSPPASSQPVVAEVGGAPITKAMLQHWLALQGRRALGFLIEAQRTIGQAAEIGTTISDSRAQSTLEQFRYNQIYGTVQPLPGEAQLAKLLAGKAETPADQLWLVKVHLLATEVERRRIADAERKVPYAAVASYYRANRARFVLPERRDVEAVMAWKKDAVLQAKREIEAGESFKSVAERRNEQPSEGGIRHNLSRASIGPKRYEQDFFAPVKLNRLIGPLKERMYYIYEVTRIVPARQQALAEVQGQIRRQLIAGPQRHLLTAIVAAANRRWRARTHCRAGYAAPECGPVALS